MTAGDYPAGAAIFVQDDCPGCTRRSVRWLARLAQRGRRGYGQSTAECDATTDLYWRRVTPSEVLGDIPQRPSLNSPNSQVGNDDIGQRLR